MTAPTPDLKPHIPPPASGTECCGCCEGIEAETPQAVSNRGGLSTIAYRIGEYADFRASLHAALSSSALKPLPDLRTRDDDDYTIGLIDAFACSADVLTFYQERIANESWLQTAVERVSLQEMGKLVGYRLRPGVAAETWLAFAVEAPPTPPAAITPEPGSFITGVPTSVKLAVGLKVQSIPGPDEKPQTFELVEALDDARAGWSAIRPWLGETYVPARDDREAWLAGVATNLKPGDALLFVGQEFFGDNTSDRWDFRLLTAVEPDNENNRTRVAWARGLGASIPFNNPAANPYVFALRKRAAVFGHNAPDWNSMSDDFRSDYTAAHGDSLFSNVVLESGISAMALSDFEVIDIGIGILGVSDWPRFKISPVPADANGGAVDLDAVHADIGADLPGNVSRRSFAVLARGNFNRPDEDFPADTYVELYRVTGTTEVSRAAFAISGKVTRLYLAGENLADIFYNQVRQTSIYAKSELLPLAERPVTTAVAGDRVPAKVSAAGLLPGRRLIISGVRADNASPVVVQATLVAVHAVAAGRCELEIAPHLPAALRRDSVIVNANVALASHGETVTEILGAGDASRSFQRFELKQLPLTYRAAANELGAAAELTVRVGDVAWKERSTLYGALPTERALRLVVDERGRRFVEFGDGLNGRRLPSGVNNVRATYRKGLGVDGNVDAGSLTQLMSRPLGLKGVSNPLVAEGGTDPEPASQARRTIPLTTRTLGRAVSLLDYEDFARAFSGIAKAQAEVLVIGGGKTVAITLAAPDGALLTPASPVWQNLLDALKSSGDPNVSVTLLSYQASTFRLGLSVKCDPDYEPQTVLGNVEAALRAHYAFDARSLGQPVQQSDVIATSQAVQGVVAVDMTRLYGGTRPVQQTLVSQQVRLLASRMRVELGVAKASELLTLDPSPLDLLEVMP